MFFGGNLWYYLGDILKIYMAGWKRYSILNFFPIDIFFPIWESLLGKVSSFNEPAAVVWEALEGHNLTQALQLLHSPGQRKSYTFIRLSVSPQHCTAQQTAASSTAAEQWRIRLRLRDPLLSESRRSVGQVKPPHQQTHQPTSTSPVLLT